MFHSEDAKPSWHLLTGEYPPQPGGVSDYTYNLANHLASAGERVHVWAPRLDSGNDTLQWSSGVVVHRLPQGFSPSGLCELDRQLNQTPRPRRLVLQYVPHAFGCRAANVPLCLWFASRRADRRWVMFHEVAVSFGGPSLRKNSVAAANHAMATILVNSAHQVLVSVPAWNRKLASLEWGSLSSEWVPVPSNLPTSADGLRVKEVREQTRAGTSQLILGHFGTYGPLLAPLLSALVPALLTEPNRRLLLVGRGSAQFAEQLRSARPGISARVVATGSLGPEETAAHLSACDLLVQPFSDGLSTRRTSLMAGLALGLPIVSNIGPHTEPLWHDLRPVALTPSTSPSEFAAVVSSLCSNPSELSRLSLAAKSAYEHHFSAARMLASFLRIAETDGPRSSTRSIDG